MIKNSQILKGTISLIVNGIFLHILNNFGYFPWILKCYKKTLELFFNFQNVTLTECSQVILSDLAAIASGMIVLSFACDWIPDKIISVLNYKNNILKNEIDTKNTLLLFAAAILCTTLCTACGNYTNSQSSDNTTENSFSVSGNILEDDSYDGWLPYVGFAEITYAEQLHCIVSKKQFFDYIPYKGSNFYYITVQTEDGSVLRFRTSQDIFDSVQPEQDIYILFCQVKAALGGVEYQYYIDKEMLRDVLIVSVTSGSLISPEVGEYATLISEMEQKFTGINFEHDEYYVGVSGKGGYFVEHYYTFLKNENDEIICIEDKNFFELLAPEDTLNILVQTVDYPVGGEQFRYCYQGNVLNVIAR